MKNLLIIPFFYPPVLRLKIEKNSGPVRNLGWPCYHHTSVLQHTVAIRKPEPSSPRLLGNVGLISQSFGRIWTCVSTYRWMTQEWPKQIIFKVSLCLKQLNWLCLQEWSPLHSSSKQSNIHTPRQTSQRYLHVSAGHWINLSRALMCHCAGDGVFLWRSP